MRNRVQVRTIAVDDMDIRFGKGAAKPGWVSATSAPSGDIINSVEGPWGSSMVTWTVTIPHPRDGVRMAASSGPARCTLPGRVHSWESQYL